VEQAPPPKGRADMVLRWGVGGVFIALAAFVVLVVAHAATGAANLVTAAQGSGVIFVGLAVASAVLGIATSWRRYPNHRRVIIFIVVLTLITLSAHAYAIGSPSASTPGLVSGAAGSSFSDSNIMVNSSVTGNQLSVTVTDSGSNSISSLDLSSAGVLPGGGFAVPPSYAAPLQPGGSAQGSWTLSSGSSSANLTVNYQTLSCYDQKDQVYGCIMDEVYYVPAAQHLLAGAQCQLNADRAGPGYCNPEHPPLVKALMAAGMFVFGEYNVVGWRVMPALLGTFCIPLIFGVAWKLSGSKKVASLSALLLALDVMFFSQSGGGLLDIPPVFFALAGFLVYLAGLKWWKADRYVLAGVLLGLSGLSKETSIFLALALVTFILLFEGGSRANRLYSSFKVILVVGLVFAAGLQVYDSTMAASAFPTFVQHVSYMLSYGSSLIANKLACSPVTGYWCKYPNDPGGPPILPTDWLVYYSPVGYYVTSVTITPGGTYTSIGYYGVPNLIETWTTFIWVPLAAYAIFAYYRSRRLPIEQAGEGHDLASIAATEPISSPVAAPEQEMSGETRFAAFALVFFLWSYVPYILLFLGGRVTYPFYFVPAIPAVAMGAAYWLNKNWFPKALIVVFLLAAFMFFLVYFPDKAFLPIWLRILLRH
jgi:predicted membrane-bound dolichyl-phosphate-mannose-protein mannosyltransferase